MRQKVTLRRARTEAIQAEPTPIRGWQWWALQVLP